MTLQDTTQGVAMSLSDNGVPDGEPKILLVLSSYSPFKSWHDYP